MMKGTRIVGLLLIGLLLGACSGNTCDRPSYYLNSGSTGEIVLPEGATAPDTRSSLKIPPPSGTLERGEDSPCLEQPPAYYEQSGAIVGSPEALVYAWAEAVSMKNIDNLQSLYSDYFTPVEGDMAAWKTEKQRQMQALGEGRLTVDKLSMAPAPGGRMIAKFIQHIQSGNSVTESRMELILARDKNSWSIIGESLAQEN
ncbi:MAG: hypothetical protein MUP90_00965 [Gammaproteobacteria bacterium]|nr:hypothetical protein [Gammaproteobacteria bacterium]